VGWDSPDANPDPHGPIDLAPWIRRALRKKVVGMQTVPADEQRNIFKILLILEGVRIVRASAKFPKNIKLTNYKLFSFFYIFTRKSCCSLWLTCRYGLRLINEVSMRVRGSQL
jgi:hypothetical protein